MKLLFPLLPSPPRSDALNHNSPPRIVMDILEVLIPQQKINVLEAAFNGSAPPFRVAASQTEPRDPPRFCLGTSRYPGRISPHSHSPGSPKSASAIPSIAFQRPSSSAY